MNNQLAFILLNKPSQANKEMIQDQLLNDWGSEYKISDYSEKEKAITFNVQSAMVAVAEMPIQIPYSDLEFPIKTAWYWDSVEQDIEKHKSHLVVYGNGETTKKEITIIVTRVCSSLLKIEDGIGVYWGSSSQVIQKDLFNNYAEMLKDGTSPVPIWIKTTGYQNDNERLYLYTIGLKDFGIRELEIENYLGDWNDGLSFLMEISNYLIENGQKIKNGDTVGSTEQEMITAKYKKSSLNKDENVISFTWR